MSRAARATKGDAVTLSRSRYEALLRKAEAGDDAPALAAVAAREAREEALGKEVARADYLPSDLVKRMVLGGESPVRIWREHRQITAKALAAEAGMPASYLSDIENGKKPGSFDAMARIAKALKVSLDDLVPGSE